MPIQKLIDDALLKEQEQRATRERSGKWSPSSFGYCYRRQYFNRKNEQPTNPPDIIGLRKFRAGKIFHNVIQGLIPDSQTEVKIEDTDILGFADIVTEDTVYDIKSINSKGFFYLKDDTIKETQYQKWLQVACYGKYLKKPKICLAFVDKDNLLINEYVEFTEHWIGEVDKEIAFLRSIWQEGKLPKASPRAYGGKECAWGKDGKYKCPYHDKCKEMGDIK